MLSNLRARLYQGYRTIPYPKAPAPIPDRARGLPVINQQALDAESCKQAAELCPTDAIAYSNELNIDLGRCVFCGRCEKLLPEGAVKFTNEYRLSSRTREGLSVGEHLLQRGEALEQKTKQLFGRSLHLRQVSAAGCNGCEVDFNVLNTIGFDLSRFGIKVVASPRHADGIVVTGPVSNNMKLGLIKTYQAVPEPKLVIALGTCAISGGLFRDHPETSNGVEPTLPVDLYIPGCPPHPMTILDGMLALLGKL